MEQKSATKKKMVRQRREIATERDWQCMYPVLHFGVVVAAVAWYSCVVCHVNKGNIYLIVDGYAPKPMALNAYTDTPRKKKQKQEKYTNHEARLHSNALFTQVEKLSRIWLTSPSQSLEGPLKPLSLSLFPLSNSVLSDLLFACLCLCIGCYFLVLHPLLPMKCLFCACYVVVIILYISCVMLLLMCLLLNSL